jgi:hypothetical protein
VEGITLVEYLPIIDFLDDRIGGAYVLNVGMRQFLISPEAWQRVRSSPRLGLPSPVLGEWMRGRGLEAEPPSGNYFRDEYKFLSTRLLPTAEHLLFGPPEIDRYLELLRPGEGEIDRKLDEYRQLQNTFLLHYKTWHEDNFELLAGIVELIRRRSGARVALLEGAWHPRFVRDVEQKRYRRDIADFAARHDVPHWDLNRDSRLGDAAFFDLAHIGDPRARVRFARVLAGRLAELLGDPAEEDGER